MSWSRRVVTAFVAVASVWWSAPASADRKAIEVEIGEETTTVKDDGAVCTYQSDMRIASNTRTVTGTMTYVNIDGIRMRYDSVTKEAWIWSYRTCTDSDPATPDYGEPYWRQISDPDPVILIDDAYDRAVGYIDDPEAVLSPSARGVVNLGMWLAVEPQDAVIIRAEAGSSWAEVRATQKATTFDFGNGDTVTCDGLGSPIPESEKDTLDEGPCGYTYRSANDGEPYTITITSTWAITWELSDGRTGTRPDVTLTTTFEYPVVEIQTVGTNG